ncbi:MAG: protein kinase [Pirellulales bacterium]|nr:protein kinase [Pirellulales bacterium]
MKAGESFESRADELLAHWDTLRAQGESVSLSKLCGDDTELRDEVARRIGLLESIDKFLIDLQGDSSWPDEVANTGRGDHSFVVESPTTLGRYQLEQLIGEGGFGQVWRGRDPELDRDVAIKIPRPGRLGSRIQAARFLEEARKVAKLHHPSIVQVFDVGPNRSGCYIVSQWIEGTDLAKRIAAGRLSFDESARIVAEVAEALHHAHLQGLVHRDIKPGNILLDAQGKAYVTDFGIAASEDELLDEQDVVTGTPLYMAPEQASGEGLRVTARADIYSLGVVLYELLTGRPPFRAGRRADLREQVLKREPRPPRTIDDSIPPEVERICFKAMAKDPGQRYTTAADLARDLREHASRVASAPRSNTPRFWRWLVAAPIAASLILVIAFMLRPATLIITQPGPLGNGGEAAPDDLPPVIAPIGDIVSQALAAAGELGAGEDQSFALSSIAASQAKSGFVDGAFRTVERVERESWRAFGLTEIATAQAKAGLTAEAQRTFYDALAAARQIKELPPLVGATGVVINRNGEAARRKKDIATSQAEAGFFDDALATAEGIEGFEAVCQSALSNIAAAQAKARLFDKALVTAEKMLSGITALDQIATAQAEAGLFGEAMATIGKIEDVPWRAPALSKVAAAQAKAGLKPIAQQTFDQALAAANNAKEAWVEAWLLRNIAVAQAQAGFFDSALETVAHIEVASRTTVGLIEIGAGALGEIAAEQAKAGMPAEAQKTFDKALAAGRRVEYCSSPTDVLADIAALEIQAGFTTRARTTLDEALTATEGIRDTVSGELRFEKIASTQAAAGLLDAALVTARRIQNISARASTLRKIGAAQAAAGQPAAALSWAEKERDAFVRSLSYLGIFEGLSAQNQ